MVITELPTEAGNVTRDADIPNLYTESAQRDEEIAVVRRTPALATDV